MRETLAQNRATLGSVRDVNDFCVFWVKIRELADPENWALLNKKEQEKMLHYMKYLSDVGCKDD